MGTRADFYIGRGPEAEWLGSVGWDGYPDGIFDGEDGSLVLAALTTPKAWRSAVGAFLAARDDATLPERGWPWPWDDSQTTDYAYAFDGQVYGSCFGHGWWLVADRLAAPEREDEDRVPKVEFPNMRARKNVRYDKGSGAIFLGVKP